MAPRSRKTAITPNNKVDEAIQLTIAGKPVGPGAMMSITGERGLFKFKSVSWSKEGNMSLTFVGGVVGEECWRSFRPERVKKVH
jgi:hypothetical protein